MKANLQIVFFFASTFLAFFIFLGGLFLVVIEYFLKVIVKKLENHLLKLELFCFGERILLIGVWRKVVDLVNMF